ncbi:MAG: hypothetical protein EAX95_13005 [Candidatus Thorarchaeota archaeon]|nr:hypothetical protein [Candidatus Thorarchaeota archaeon]
MVKISSEMKEEMNLKKHKDALADRIRFLDEPSDSQLAKEIIELYEARCSECQEDRLGCTVRPACSNRNFLNVLIELGVDPEDLPNYCYGRYLEAVKRYILERKGRGMNDRRIPTKDFLSTLRVSSIKHFLSRFSKIWTKTSEVKEQNLDLIAGDDLLFHFDFERNVVIVNPWNQPIRDFQIFRLYNQLLSSHYQVSSEVESLTSNWWSLSLELEDVKTTKESSLGDEGLLSHFEDFHLVLEDGVGRIEAEVIVGNGRDNFAVRDLVLLYQSAEQLQKRKKQ